MIGSVSLRKDTHWNTHWRRTSLGMMSLNLEDVDSVKQEAKRINHLLAQKTGFRPSQCFVPVK